MKIIFAALFAIVLMTGWSATDVSAAPTGQYQDQKVVYHNDGGAPDNAAYFKRMLNSIKNHIEAVGKDLIEIRVVDHSAGQHGKNIPDQRGHRTDLADSIVQ